MRHVWLALTMASLLVGCGSVPVPRNVGSAGRQVESSQQVQPSTASGQQFQSYPASGTVALQPAAVDQLTMADVDWVMVTSRYDPDSQSLHLSPTTNDADLAPLIDAYNQVKTVRKRDVGTTTQVQVAITLKSGMKIELAIAEHSPVFGTIGDKAVWLDSDELYQTILGFGPKLKTSP